MFTGDYRKVFTGNCTIELKEGIHRRLYCRTEGRCSQETTGRYSQEIVL